MPTSAPVLPRLRVGIKPWTGPGSSAVVLFAAATSPLEADVSIPADRPVAIAAPDLRKSRRFDCAAC